jgi:hypothetical protein
MAPFLWLKIQLLHCRKTGEIRQSVVFRTSHPQPTPPGAGRKPQRYRLRSQYFKAPTEAAHTISHAGAIVALLRYSHK